MNQEDIESKAVDSDKSDKSVSVGHEYEEVLELIGMSFNNIDNIIMQYSFMQYIPV